MNPFDLQGPQFLFLYAVVFGLAVFIAAYLRWYLRQPSDATFTRFAICQRTRSRILAGETS